MANSSLPEKWVNTQTTSTFLLSLSLCVQWNARLPHDSSVSSSSKHAQQRNYEEALARLQAHVQRASISTAPETIAPAFQESPAETVRGPLHHVESKLCRMALCRPSKTAEHYIS